MLPELVSAIAEPCLGVCYALMGGWLLVFLRYIFWFASTSRASEHNQIYLSTYSCDYFRQSPYVHVLFKRDMCCLFPEYWIACLNSVHVRQHRVLYRSCAIMWVYLDLPQNPEQATQDVGSDYVNETHFITMCAEGSAHSQCSNLTECCSPIQRGMVAVNSWVLNPFELVLHLF